jgi:hypothetical protein
MIYFAIIMVVLGVLCFVYAILPGLKKKRSDGSFSEQGRGSSYRKSSGAFSTVSNDIGRETKYPLFNMKYPEKKESVDMEERIRMERRVTKRQKINIETHEPLIKKTTDNDVKTLEAADEPLSGIEEVLETAAPSEGLSQKETPLFTLEGLLFLDYGRKIPFQNKKIKEFEWKEEYFSSFKRIGLVEFRGFSNRFEFSIGSSIYDYEIDKLSQVIFYENAFALMTENQTVPVPLLFTKEMESFKEFLAKL